MLTPLNFATVIYLFFMFGGILSLVAAFAKRPTIPAWKRTALWLLAPSLLGLGFLSLALRHNALHFSLPVYHAAGVVDHLCGGASLALLLLLGWSLGSNPSLPRPKTGE